MKNQTKKHTPEVNEFAKFDEFVSKIVKVPKREIEGREKIAREKEKVKKG